jgi:hypothetical protein
LREERDDKRNDERDNNKGDDKRSASAIDKRDDKGLMSETLGPTLRSPWPPPISTTIYHGQQHNNQISKGGKRGRMAKREERQWV